MAGKKRILLTGVSGFLGTYLAMYLRQYYHVYGLYFNTLPVYSGVQSFRCNMMVQSDFGRVLSVLRPDVLIQAAGLKSVEMCEEHKRFAEDLHVGMTSYLTKVAKSNYHFILISTAQVYSGQTGKYHTEKHNIIARNTFGNTKKRAEEMIIEQNLRHTIFRLGQLYGISNGARGSFLDEWSRQLAKKEPVDVVADRYFTPLFVEDVGRAIRLAIESQSKKHGLYNLGGQDRTSPFSFALKFAKYMGYDPTLIKPVLQETVESQVAYGKDTSMDSSAFVKDFGYRARGVLDSLKIMKARLASGWTDLREMEPPESFETDDWDDDELWEDEFEDEGMEAESTENTLEENAVEGADPDFCEFPRATEPAEVAEEVELEAPVEAKDEEKVEEEPLPKKEKKAKKKDKKESKKKKDSTDLNS